MRNISKVLLNLIYPLRCPLCQRPLYAPGESYLCQQCSSKIKRLTLSTCKGCAKPFFEKKSLCFECKGKKFYYDKVVVAAIYDDIIRRSIHLLKYARKTALAKPLGILLIEAVSRLDCIGQIDLAIPVPLHNRQLRRRGFNQAEILARSCRQRLAIPVSTGNLVKAKLTHTQSDLKRDERFKNVEGAFLVKKPSDVKDKNILLIDDVLTTGATLNECARTLKRAGAEKIIAMAIARGL